MKGADVLMYRKLIQVSEVAIKVAKDARFLQNLDLITIKDHPDGTLVFFKFRSFGRVSIQEISFSPRALYSAIHANFTFIERFKYRKILILVAIEAILMFINNVFLMVGTMPETVYDEWRYLGMVRFIPAMTDEQAAKNYDNHLRGNKFLEFVSESLLPNTDRPFGSFPYKALGISVDGVYREKIFRIFSDVIYKEVARSIHH
jgi:hypothetical protein